MIKKKKEKKIVCAISDALKWDYNNWNATHINIIS